MNKNKLLPLGLFTVIIITAAFFFVKTNYSRAGNETSRLAVIQSVVDNGTFDISKSIFQTPDKALLNGKYYGDKPPLLTFLSMGEYFILAEIFGITFKDHYKLTFFLLYLPYFLVGCLCCFLFYMILNRYIAGTSSQRYRITASVLALVSTLVFSYSVTMGNHVPTAALLLWLILQMDNTEKSDFAVKDLLLCGVITGLIFNCEFVTGGAFAAGVFFFVIMAKAENWNIRIKRGILYSAGVLLLIAVEGFLNYISYGSPLPLYLLTHKPDMAQKDYLYYAWNVLFGFEGFFLYMPACLFLFPVLCNNFPGRNRICKCILGSTLFATVIFLTATSDYGGFCYGYRFLIPFAPVILLYVFLSFQAQRKNGVCYILFCAALGWGVITSYFGTQNPWNSGYEGSLTKKGNFNEKIKNGFLGNVYVFSYEKMPDSALTKYFIEQVYGPQIAWLYLYEELLNRNENNKVPQAYQYFVKNYFPATPRK